MCAHLLLSMPVSCFINCHTTAFRAHKDMEVLTLSCIKSIVERHPLSEQQARNLIVREQNGLDRKAVIEYFALVGREQQQVMQAQREAMKAARLAAKREAAEREVALRAAYAAQAQAYEEKRVAKRKQALLEVKRTLQTKMAAEREARVQAEQACMKAKLEAVERRAAIRKAADRKLQEERERKWKLQDEAESIALRVSVICAFSGIHWYHTHMLLCNFFPGMRVSVRLVILYHHW